jgi:hypothetical protein
MLNSHHKDTEEIVHRNMRMGINPTGIAMASEEQLSWLDSGYEYLRHFDYEYSKQLGVPTSIKLTTVQPSGTLSLLPGVTPGVHPAYAQYIKRRVRIASNHSLVDLCRRCNYPIEYQRNFDGTEDRSTYVITFPFAYPEGTLLAKDTTAIKQLELVKFMQEHWSDNAVSCTVYYREEELPEIVNYLEENYEHCFKSLSFMLASDHGFSQAPLEEITKEEYEALTAKVTPITDVIVMGEGDADISESCDSGHCPIR